MTRPPYQRTAPRVAHEMRDIAALESALRECIASGKAPRALITTLGRWLEVENPAACREPALRLLREVVIEGVGVAASARVMLDMVEAWWEAQQTEAAWRP